MMVVFIWLFCINVTNPDVSLIDWLIIVFVGEWHISFDLTDIWSDALVSVSMATPSSVSTHRMLLPRLLRCPRRPGAVPPVCGHATLGGSSTPLEKDHAGPVFQYVGKHRTPNHKVFVWGFSFTGALGIPSFVVPPSGRKKPRKYQLTPYRLDTVEQVRTRTSRLSDPQDVVHTPLCLW